MFIITLCTENLTNSDLQGILFITVQPKLPDEFPNFKVLLEVDFRHVEYTI
jgi:hypothetical protein